MRSLLLALSMLACVCAQASAESCPGNPDAIGTSRTITVDPATLPLIGTMQYKQSVPLEDHEVVITFDDGPIPPYSTHVLDTLKENCVKATYFLVGEMARAHPWLVRRIYNEGHTIGTHTETHPLALDRKGMPRIEQEIDRGFDSVRTAVGDPSAVSPYFRIPGLARSNQIENLLASQSIAIWSADEVADDWRHISAGEIVKRAIRRIEEHDHRGVLLLHDIHPATALALPTILKELKERGYKIVQVVPPGVGPASVPELAPPVVAAHEAWPRVVKASVTRRHASRLLHHHRARARLVRKHHVAKASRAKADYASAAREWHADAY